MFFPRRSGAPVQKYLYARVGLFFLAAGLWIAGAMGGNTIFTGTAIVIAVLGVALGLIARRSG